VCGDDVYFWGTPPGDGGAEDESGAGYNHRGTYPDELAEQTEANGPDPLTANPNAGEHAERPSAGAVGRCELNSRTDLGKQDQRRCPEPEHADQRDWWRAEADHRDQWDGRCEVRSDRKPSWAEPDDRGAKEQYANDRPHSDCGKQ
jgi:hypothetical protein